MRELGEVRVHQDGETTVLAPGMNTRLFREGELFYEVECRRIADEVERLGPEELEALVVAAVAEARAISARAAASDS